MLKKLTKKDYLFIGAIIAAFTAFVIIMTHGDYIWGSPTDWQDQHIVLPDYFRKLFYKTGDLFPSFAANIGAGQNIFNFAYYGLYNPIILFSFLLPFVSMKSYIIAASVLGVIVSTILLYIYFRKSGKKSETALIVSLIFLFAGPVIYHSHQHIMFINYMPFLISAFFAMDRYLTKKKPGLLIMFSVFIILTSFYYSICALLCLFIFGIYRYLKMHRFAKFKEVMLQAFKLIMYLGLAVLISAFFLVPTALALLSGRGNSEVGGGISQLLSYCIPKISFTTLLYSPRSFGLTAIAIVALVGNFFSQKKHLIFLSTVFSVIFFIPAINYITNGFLYIDGKTFIPFLPLCLIMISEFLRKVFIERKLNIRAVIIFIAVAVIGGVTTFFEENLSPAILIFFGIDSAVTLLVLFLYTKLPLRRIVASWLVILALVDTLYVNLVFTDDFIETEDYLKYNSADAENLVETALADDSDFFRLSENYAALDSLNRVYSAEHYQTTQYSSTFNSEYRSFYYDLFNNEISFRNASITNATTNVLFNMLMNNRYIIAKSCPAAGYREVATKGEYKLYRNDDVYSLGYLTDKLMSEKQFESLEYPYSSEALMKYIIVDDNSIPEVDFNPEIKTYTPKVISALPNDLFGCYELYGDSLSDGCRLESERGGRLDLTLGGELTDLLFIRLTLNKSQSEYSGDRIITINGTKNKLTSLSSRYHNGNNVFDYVISAAEPIDTISLWLSKGIYDIEKIECWALPYSSLSSLSESFDSLEVNRSETEGDIICGSINSSKSGIMSISIPYDSGFSISVDGNATDYFKTDTAFIGIRLEKGEHEISIEYTAPGQRIGMIISIVALLAYILLILYSLLRKSRPSVEYEE